MYTRILLPIDANGAPEGVAAHAISLAKAHGAAILVLRVIPIVSTGEAFFEQIQVELGSRGAKLRAEALAHFALLEAQCRDSGVSLSGEAIFSEKNEADAIVGYAVQKGCDLIVMPTRPQAALSRWLMGNVAEKVRRRAAVPVLYVPIAE